MTEKTKGKVGRPMGKLHQDDVRKKIQVSQLIKKLENHALSDDDTAEISPSKMKAIQILLNKSLPDLSSMQITGDDENPLVVENNHNVFGELLKAIKLQRQTEE
jgi:hypothetical protein